MSFDVVAFFRPVADDCIGILAVKNSGFSVVHMRVGNVFLRIHPAKNSRKLFVWVVCTVTL